MKTLGSAALVIIVAAAAVVFWGGLAVGAPAKTRSPVDRATAATRPTSQPTTQPVPGTKPSPSATTQPATGKVLAYYFHRTLRCPTCLKIEATARRSIEAAFDRELTLETLEWQAVNIDEPANEHFQADFEIGGPSLILVCLDGTRRMSWKNLEKIWELVGDEARFTTYVQGEVSSYLQASRRNTSRKAPASQPERAGRKGGRR